MADPADAATPIPAGATSPGQPARAPVHRAVGAGRVLTLVYGFFTLAAGARSTVQLLTKASDARLAYTLSAAAALIYLTGTLMVTLADGNPAWRTWAVRLCLLELSGVVLIGTVSIVVPRAFPDATVWSRYGSGYGFVPLVLPLLALFWLHPRAPGAATPAEAAD